MATSPYEKKILEWDAKTQTFILKRTLYTVCTDSVTMYTTKFGQQTNAEILTNF